MATMTAGLASCGSGAQSLDPAPPAISGGTLLVTRGGLAVAADPERDCLWITRLGPDGSAAVPKVTYVSVAAGDEPGRLVEDAAGKIHVAMRRSGDVVTVDPNAGVVVDRRSVCSAPRGVAFDAAADTILVACSGGELVTLPAAGGPALRRLQLDDDLRDVVIDGDRVLVSRFRSAELLILDRAGAVTSRLVPPVSAPSRAPHVAWRLAALPGGGAVMAYQSHLIDAPPPTPTPVYYSDGDGAVVTSAVAVLPPADVDAPGEPALFLVTDSLGRAVLPADVAISPDGSKLALLAAGSRRVLQFVNDPYTSSTWMSNAPNLASESPVGCGAIDPTHCQPTAVAYDAAGNLVTFLREPATLAGLTLPAWSRLDDGHELFHQSPSGFVACASCHPEGRDDGHVWRIDGEDKPRRTQSLAGGVSSRAPFHWEGDLPDLPALMDLVFVTRMGGRDPGPDRIDALAHWMDTIPTLPRPSTNPGAAARGATLFTDAALGCAGCHGGPEPTSRERFDVGTGDRFQAPSLAGVGSRAPYMHDGCAATLRDRFAPGPCGGGDQHGNTSRLTAGDIDDLVAYLEAL